MVLRELFKKGRRKHKMKSIRAFIVGIIALLSSVAQAALIDTSVCVNSSGCGYYLPYEGRLAGFFTGDLNGTPILQMSIDPGIYPPPNGTPVSLFTYSDVMAANSGFTLEEQVKLSQIGALMDTAIAPINFAIDGVTPPTVCVHDWCEGYSAAVNALAWNIWGSGSVSLEVYPLGGPDGAYALDGWYTSLTSGSYDQFNWGTEMLLMQVSGGDTFVIPLGSASSESLTMHTPVPASMWLFGSGLLGLVAVSRRRTHQTWA